MSEVLPTILSDLREYGEEVGSRNGRVKELLNPQITLTQPDHREVLSINRKANVYAQIAETMWVLAGRNDIEWLSAYLPRAPEFSDDGSTWRGGYGPRIRRGHFDVDQLAYVIDTLREDPLSRRAVISIYDPWVDTVPGKDIPCNDFLQFQSRNGQLHLTVTVRSNDAMWGWSGINAFEWSTLQEIVASLLGIHVGDLTFNIGSLHLYERHWERAKRIEHEDLEYPTVRFDPDRLFDDIRQVDLLIDRWFIWEGLCRKGEATVELLDEWEEPLFRSWAAAIAYFWQREQEWVDEVSDTALAVAMARTPASVLPEPIQKPSEASRGQATGTSTPGAPSEPVRAFYEYVTNLHAEKHASYGDSWKKRGELVSILPNIARKIDRLGVGDSFDSEADTALDLFVYLAKYLCWMDDTESGPDEVNPWLSFALDVTRANDPMTKWRDYIPGSLNTYINRVINGDEIGKRPFIKDMLCIVAPVARDLWYIENEYRPDLGQ